ncbi:MAG: hypothetical protein E7290_06070 [Lachnospiraceae bacterium]|nr:hypothetical protein [Lachnospiraceae bacterium]
MNNKEYNEHRHNRKKQQYRFALGFQQFINYPAMNLLWGFFAVGIMFLVAGEKKLISNIEIHPMFISKFYACMQAISIVFPIICAIGIIQFIGFCFSIRDEADMELVFGDKRDVKNLPPILVYKKKDRKSGVIKREFYTTIPMERWQEKKEAICDRMDIHLVGDITYGGRKKNKGYRIYFESAKGRKVKERGALYDDTF